MSKVPARDKRYELCALTLSDPKVSPKDASAAADEVVRLARGLICAALSDHQVVLSQLDKDCEEFIITDTLVEVLTMARHYDPSRGVPFAKWLTSAHAPWRSRLESAISEARFGPHMSRAEREVTQLAQVIISEHMSVHGVEPSPKQLRAALDARTAPRAETNSEEMSVLQARNRKSGFAAAVENVEALLQFQTQTYPDADLEGRQWDVFKVEDDGFSTVDAEAETTAWVRLAGDLSDKTRAANRMACPHAQWIHVVPAPLLNTLPSLPH